MTTYAALTTDSVLVANTSTTTTTITLPASPTTGQTYKVIDGSGNASVNNITLDGNGKNINGSSTLTINTNYEVKTLIYNGTEWSAY